jgi:hypothetical protein
MDDHAEQSQRLGSIDFVDERRNRLLAQEGECRCQVDQITCVRDDGRDARLLDALAKQFDLGGIERLGAPLVRILREDLQRFASVGDGAVDCFGNAARHRHVCADAHHSL